LYNTHILQGDVMSSGDYRSLTALDAPHSATNALNVEFGESWCSPQPGVPQALAAQLQAVLQKHMCLLLLALQQREPE
jgi:hypothetical protein